MNKNAKVKKKKKKKEELNKIINLLSLTFKVVSSISLSHNLYIQISIGPNPEP